MLQRKTSKLVRWCASGGGRWRTNLHTGARCPCSLLVALTQYRMLLGTGERVGQSATIWKQWETLLSSGRPLGGTHCGNVCFNFACYDCSWKPKWDFPLYWVTMKVKELRLKLMEFLLQKGLLDIGYPQDHPFISIALVFESLQTLVQFLLTFQQPLNPLQNVLPWRVVLMS